jgi:hypothetical protein
LSSNTQRLFELGRLSATPAALQAIEDSGQQTEEFLNRHVQGDWGTLSEIDQHNNQEALVTGDRIFSCYRTDNGTKIWIVTEPADEQGDRNRTTIILPSEY